MPFSHLLTAWRLTPRLSATNSWVMEQRIRWSFSTSPRDRRRISDSCRWGSLFTYLRRALKTKISSLTNMTMQKTASARRISARGITKKILMSIQIFLSFVWLYLTTNHRLRQETMAQLPVAEGKSRAAVTGAYSVCGNRSGPP